MTAQERCCEDERPAVECPVHFGTGVGIYYGLGVIAIGAVAWLRRRGVAGGF